ncbi:hypothetical protein [Halalkalibacter okhensis]|uniref:Uncharacterized protein n=1 Tax=Halalkalibacter okhensis TaxID=333138 RepID=A0A0B0IMU5_9BACI|nr:hypothetical protein [Halalkalibacter okhensis]KHF41001.1 hypothetical protein LQ50_06335 [Halalkalibacter okhensis]
MYTIVPIALKYSYFLMINEVASGYKTKAGIQNISRRGERKREEPPFLKSEEVALAAHAVRAKENPTPLRLNPNGGSAHRFEVKEKGKSPLFLKSEEVALAPHAVRAKENPTPLRLNLNGGSAHRFEVKEKGKSPLF